MKFKQPPPLQPGDKVAIVSPSSGMPFLFPCALKDYKANITVVFNMNFGHTDPQISPMAN